MTISTMEKTVAADQVVLMNYQLKDDAGNAIDASTDEPMAYLHGHSNIIPGLEKALTGLKPGDKKEVVVAPTEGYGERQPDLQFKLPRAQFGDQVPQAGMMIELQAAEDHMMAHIVEVNDQEVTLDGNHPMAGKTLHFQIEIVDIRPATQEELQHGHPHGPDGHHHH